MAQQYDEKYKMEIAQLIVQEGKVMAQVGRELDIPADTLRNWVNKYKREYLSQDGSKGITLDQESLEEKDKQIKDLKEEREILKKALHIFNKDHT